MRFKNRDNKNNRKKHTHYTSSNGRGWIIFRIIIIIIIKSARGSQEQIKHIHKSGYIWRVHCDIKGSNKPSGKHSVLATRPIIIKMYNVSSNTPTLYVILFIFVKHTHTHTSTHEAHIRIYMHVLYRENKKKTRTRCDTHLYRKKKTISIRSLYTSLIDPNMLAIALFILYIYFCIFSHLSVRVCFTLIYIYVNIYTCSWKKMG